MPWHIQQGGGTCGSSEYAVIKDSDGSTAGCHPTKAEAEAQMAALYANEPSMNAQHAAQLRAQAAKSGQLEAIPAAKGRRLPFKPQLEVRKVERDGQEFYHLHGTATVYEKRYQMYDVFGDYKEIVSSRAGAVSLSKNPDVKFLANHEGLSLARTTNGTLELSEDDHGLDYDAYLNPKRYDVSDLVNAVGDKTIDESSFAFMIDDGKWNDDFSEYRINMYDIDRGDVSAVNHGASPWTSVAARQQIVLAELDCAPPWLARVAYARLQHRPDVISPMEMPAEQTGSRELVPQGRSVAMWHLLLDDD
jgi:hypothetical protein